jgi:hypothetical protein
VADCSLSENTAQAGDVIAFTVRNDVEYPAGFDVLQLPEGVTLEHVEQDPALDEQTQFLGWAFAEPGGTGHRGLLNLEPGAYRRLAAGWSPSSLCSKAGFEQWSALSGEPKGADVAAVCRMNRGSKCSCFPC